MLKKEKVHYLQMKMLFGEMTDYGSKFVSYPIMVIIISFFHYCFALMHFLFESFLFITNKNQFKLNLININTSTDKQLIQIV